VNYTIKSIYQEALVYEVRLIATKYPKNVYSVAADDEYVIHYWLYPINTRQRVI